MSKLAVIRSVKHPCLEVFKAQLTEVGGADSYAKFFLQELHQKWLVLVLTIPTAILTARTTNKCGIGRNNNWSSLGSPISDPRNSGKGQGQAKGEGT